MFKRQKCQCLDSYLILRVLIVFKYEHLNFQRKIYVHILNIERVSQQLATLNQRNKDDFKILEATLLTEKHNHCKELFFQ